MIVLLVGRDSSYPLPRVAKVGKGYNDAVTTAVVKKVAVATRLRGLRRDTPQRKCPLVHPLPSWHIVQPGPWIKSHDRHGLTRLPSPTRRPARPTRLHGRLAHALMPLSTPRLPIKLPTNGPNSIPPINDHLHRDLSPKTAPSMTPEMPSTRPVSVSSDEVERCSKKPPSSVCTGVKGMVFAVMSTRHAKMTRCPQPAFQNEDSLSR